MSNNTSSGVGFLGLLTVAFVVLKLTHYIDWSWWLVLGPLYIPLLLVLAIIGIGGFIAVTIRLFERGERY